MARTGLYQSEVKRARDALIAQGKHPSVDAVRIALGNTGSKTTIHKYLKELEEEDGGAGGRKASISEALQDLVERLAARLQDEANAQIDALRAAHAEQERRHAETLAAVRDQVGQLSAQQQHVDTALQQEKAAHGLTREALQRETIARHTAEQHAADLKDRLAENEAHRRSLEEKHQHARDALEHYRQSVKEQRDQDQRRHEQQLQQLQAELRQAQQAIILKQEDVTRLNQEGARLVSELSHAQTALYDQQGHGRQLEQKLAALQAVAPRAAMLEAHLGERDAQTQRLQDQLVTAADKAEGLATQVRDLELALAQSQAKVEAQQGIAAELRAYLDGRERSTGSAAQRAKQL
ncbi:integrase [Cupriavidus sp. SK-3]|uniref:DNA-binding protein n=1 Tax=Cupriavidus sp. SK-3 TaxID=1470558 RepID=UPI0004458470|nr:DNA-binding protein [Cupriavidus sp. SK-3]KDP83346.1 integrase [Cupriavidus sp. SK-3]